MAKTKFVLEYDMHGASVTLLWQYIHLPQGLELWFADRVDQSGKTFTFYWDDESHQAQLLSMRSGVYMRFRWAADAQLPERPYFEIRISASELTGNKALLITDFADGDDEQLELQSIWDQQVDLLSRQLGFS